MEQQKFTVTDLKNISKQLDDLLSAFSNTMKQMGDQISASFQYQDCYDTSQYGHCNIINKNIMKHLNDLLKNKSKICILSGAGVSKASGIQTFRGKDGFYQKQGDIQKVMQTLSYKNYQVNPKEVWEITNRLMRSVSKAKPNLSHQYLQKILDLNQQTVLVTQNVDGFDLQVKQKNINKYEYIDYYQNNIYQIHGNGYYSRCENQTCSLYRELQKVDLKVINELGTDYCQSCGQMARPNILLFDEQYDEKYYRRQELLSKIEASDCLLVIGTHLQTGLASTIVSQMFRKGITIIEINVENIIKAGHNVHYINKKSEDIMQDVYKAILQNQTNQNSSQKRYNSKPKYTNGQIKK